MLGTPRSRGALCWREAAPSPTMAEEQVPPRRDAARLPVGGDAERAGTMLKAKPTADNQFSVGLVGGDILVFPPIFMLFCVLVGIALRYAVGPLLPVPLVSLHS